MDPELRLRRREAMKSTVQQSRRNADGMLSNLRNESGVVLAGALLVMVLLSALGASVLSLSAAEFSSSRLAEHRVKAFNLAEAAQGYARRAPPPHPDPHRGRS